jgi:hypothetical protein
MNKDTKILSEIGKYFSKDGKKKPDVSHPPDDA